jgi:hypothetical protein
MHALNEFRSTPRTESYLPSQVFYNRRMKTDAPITAAALRTRTDFSAAESARQRVSDSKHNSASKQSTTRPDMIAGQTVSVQNPTTKRWDKRGIIVEARDQRNITFQVKIEGTIWTGSKIFLRPVHHIPLTDPSCAITGPPCSVGDLANFPPLTPPLPAPRRSASVQERKARETADTVNAIFTQPQEEEKKEALWPATASQRRRKRKEGAATNLQPRAAASSPPRQIAAATPPKVVTPRQTAAATPPKVVTAPSNLFNCNKPGGNIFISPHIPKIRSGIRSRTASSTRQLTTRTSRT